MRVGDMSARVGLPATALCAVALMACNNLAGLDGLAFIAPGADDGGHGGVGGGVGGANGGSGGDTTSNGGSGTGGAVSITCNAIFEDDFEDDLISSLWDPVTFSGGNNSIEETGGEIVARIDPPGLSEALLARASTEDLTGREVWLEVSSTLIQADTTTLLEMFDGPIDGLIFFQQRNGALEVLVEEVPTPIQSIYIGAYDPIAHRWWRIHHSMTALHFSVSADGVSFTELAKYEHTGVTDYTTMRIKFGTTGDVSATRTSHFERFLLCD